MTFNLAEQVTLNGQRVKLHLPVSVTTFIQQQSITGRIVIVINDEVIPKSQWPLRIIMAEDDIEVISPISGG